MKNVLITGTSTGFGRATADLLTNSGYQVIGTSRKPESVNANHQLVQLDVQSDESVKTAVEQAIEKMGTIDVLVNNAGYGLSGPIEETSMEEAKKQLDTNFFGVVRMTKAVLPYMRQQKKGLIINISSLGGMVGMPYQGFYSASKFALEGYTEALRVEVMHHGISVLNVNPGDYKTAATANRVIAKNITAAYQQRFDHTIGLYKKDELNGADPREVAKLVESLIKKEGSYKVRYLVGKSDQTLAIRLKRFVSSRFYERIIRSIYDKK